MVVTRASNRTGVNAPGRWAKAGRRGRARKLKNPPVGKVLRAKIQKVVKGDMQTKYVASFATNQAVPAGVLGPTFTAFSSGITSTNEIYAALPHTQQGTDDHQRIGDEIQPIKGQVKIDLAWNDQQNQQSFDRTVHVFLLTAVAVKDMVDVGSIPITELLDLGTGVNAGFNGTKDRSMAIVNNAGFRVLHHKQIRLSKVWGRPNGVTGTNIGGTDSIVGSIGPSYKRLVLNVRMPKKLKYDNHGATYPTNYAPFFCIGWTSNDAVGPADSSINLQVMSTVHMWYKDA